MSDILASGSTLLIWELRPEELHLYLMPNEVADKYKHFLEEAHGKFINSDDMNDGMQFLCAAIDEMCNDGFKEYDGIFKQFKLDGTVPIIGATISNVYRSGFIL